MTEHTQTIRVSTTNLLAQSSNYTTGTLDPVARELGTNAEGYCTPGQNPYMNIQLINSDDPKKACLIAQTHSKFTAKDAEHMLDIGHAPDKALEFGQRFNYGSKVPATKLCQPKKLGLHAITYDPVDGYGLVVRAYPNAASHMCRAGPHRFDLTSDGKCVSFVTTRDQKNSIHEIKRIWTETQWEVDMADGKSDAMFGAFVYDTCVRPAIQKKKAITVFLYQDLRVVFKEDGAAPECMLEEIKTETPDGTTIKDIGLRYDESEPTLRSVIRNAFCPAIACFSGMSAGGADPRRRKFCVQGEEVNVNFTVNPNKEVTNSPVSTTGESVGWLPYAAYLLNQPPVSRCAATKLMDGKVLFKCCRTLANPHKQKMRDNWYRTSKNIATVDDAMPSGVIVLYGDKKLNMRPFDAYTGDGVYHRKPKMCSTYTDLINKLFTHSHFTRDTVNEFFMLLGMPDALREVDASLPDVLRVQAAGETRRVIGKSYMEMFEIIVKPRRKALKVCNVKTLQLVEGKDSRQYVTDYEPGKRERCVLTELLGLNTTAVLQLNGMEQPINKETISDARVTDSGNSDDNLNRLYWQVLRTVVKFNVTNPSDGLSQLMKEAHKGWKKLKADEEKEVSDIQLIKKFLAERDAAAAQQEAKQAAEKRVREAAAAAGRENRRKQQAAMAEAQRERDEALATAAEETRAREAADAEARDARAKGRENKIRAENAATKEQQTKERGAREKLARTRRHVNLDASIGSRVARIQNQCGIPDEHRFNRTRQDEYVYRFSYQKNVKTAEKFAELFAAFEANSVLFDPNSLMKNGIKPVLQPWVTENMMAEALRQLYCKDALFKTLCVTKLNKPPADPAPPSAAAAAARMAAAAAVGTARAAPAGAAIEALRGSRPLGAAAAAPASAASSSSDAGCSYHPQPEAAAAADVEVHVLDASQVEVEKEVQEVEEMSDDGIEEEEEEQHTEIGEEEEDDDAAAVTAPPAKRAKTCVDIDP